ncbi:hypothetical protein AMTR_s00022p00246580 [Amborella trichopoda]|uniref:Uncharacterized protein n=1 Tax=Amborella trichopoda TaxID=13333 RepID=W1PP41_AMBTC|nr:hypothetical protein AMTR_s00022p00246580 [Amborella trichopoda]
MEMVMVGVETYKHKAYKLVEVKVQVVEVICSHMEEEEEMEMVGAETYKQKEVEGGGGDL